MPLSPWQAAAFAWGGSVNRVRNMDLKRLFCNRWAAGAGAAAFCLACWGFRGGDVGGFRVAKNLEVFNSIVRELDLFYVDTLDADEAVRAGIDAMLYSLDPYTEYYPEDDRSELDRMVENSYGGIGSVIAWDPRLERSVISEPYEHMPAAEAGLKAGDVLLSVDGEDLAGKDNAEVSGMLRGQVGTSLRLTVQRPGTEKPLEFELVRRSIELPIIPYCGVLPGDVGYICLSTFSGDPSKEFKRAFLDLKRRGIRSLVVDLRNNGGGLLDESVEIANFFLPRGKTLVTTRGKTRQATGSYKTLREPLDLDIPLAVLVNGATASSSEILAGSLQDLDRAVIVGTRTFGKGLVQTTRPLPYGGTMKLTTSRYYIPSGRCVQAVDYARRDGEGGGVRIPDSLTRVFHTAAGRVVRDGGGVTPDIEVESGRLPNILFYLVKDNLIFDYATRYSLEHDRIAPPGEFAVTDGDYADFKAMVKESGFKYDQQTGKLLESLREMAEFEGYLDGASAEFDALEKKLAHDLDHDLDHFSRDIRRMIAVEIQKRYYYQRGAVIEQLKDDEDLKAALSVLSDPARYRAMLGAPSDSSAIALPR